MEEDSRMLESLWESGYFFGEHSFFLRSANASLGGGADPGGDRATTELLDPPRGSRVEWSRFPGASYHFRMGFATNVTEV